MKQIIALRRKFEQSEENWFNDADLQNKQVAENNKKLFNKLFVDDSNYLLISSSPKVFSAIHVDDFTDNFYISEEEMNSYISGFIDSVKKNIETVLEKAVADGAEDDLNKAALDDADVKLSLYRSFRSLYDKWISKSSNGETSGYFFNNYGIEKEQRMLYDHFSFITRGGTDIGGVAVIDVSYLSNLSNKQTGQGSTQSLYQSLTELLGKNNFDFFALPSLIEYSSKDETVLKDIFTAFDGPITVEPAKPGFVCLFVGGSSRTLDIPQSYCNKNGIAFEYVNDSFDINEPSSYPEDIINNGGITAFLIKYGQQAQNHFSTIEIDQAEFKETQESLMVIDALVNPKTGSQPSQAGKGNNIYDTYLTRSYSCTVTMLGDMMIQPLMYFKLENVPMFRGTYIIKNVTHEIKPQNVKTTFVGVRQPIVTVPIVTDAISLLDLSLIDVNETSAGGGTGGGTSVVTDIPADQIFVDETIYGDNSDKQCPNVDGIKDGGIGDAYIRGKRYKVRLCKVAGALINVEMAENLNNMIKAANAAGVPLTCGSNFRTMDDQIRIAKGYGCYKSGDFVKGDCSVSTARPGYSNHQSGFAIDFGCNGQTICFEYSSDWCSKNGASKKPTEYPCFVWLQNNAANYKFYNYKKEAWHWSVDGN